LKPAQVAVPSGSPRFESCPAMKDQPQATTIAEYIAASPAQVRPILEKIRGIVAAAAPDAAERISYGMPAFAQDGMLIYFAAFKQHIGIYPPVKGDAKLNKELTPYRGEKGNLKFPLDKPMPYPLITRVVKARLAEHFEQRAAKRAAKSSGKKATKASTKKAVKKP
jgi:uncharacterized protein YdhG (YjbR/CyaY superfamily)